MTPPSSGDVRRIQPADRRPHAHRGHDLVRGQPAAAGQRKPVVAAPTPTGWPSRSRHAGLRVPGLGQRADLSADRAGQRRRARLHDGHLAAARHGGGGQLGADPACPDDHQPQRRDAAARGAPARRRASAGTAAARGPAARPAALRWRGPAGRSRYSPRSVRSTRSPNPVARSPSRTSAPSESRSARSVVSSTVAGHAAAWTAAAGHRAAAVSAPIRVISPSKPAAAQLLHGAQAGQPPPRPPLRHPAQLAAHSLATHWRPTDPARTGPRLGIARESGADRTERAAGEPPTAGT